MATATQKKPAASATATVDQQLAGMIVEAVSKWRTWAAVAADGGELPPATELFNVAAMLGIRDAGAALVADAETIRNVRVAELRLDLARRQYDERLEAEGGRDAIMRKIEEHKAEVRRLEAIVGVAAAYGLGALGGELTGAKNRSPRLFDKRYSGEGIR